MQIKVGDVDLLCVTVSRVLPNQKSSTIRSIPVLSKQTAAYVFSCENFTM